MAILNFNAEEIPSSDFEAIPAGTYEAVITDSRMKPTKAGNGAYLELDLEIISGDHKGRRLWDRLNLDNPNKQAVEIAQRSLAQICRAVDVLQPRDSEELHDKPLLVRVSTRTMNDGTPGNEVKGYMAVSRTQPAAAPQTAPAWQAQQQAPKAQPAPQAAQETAPWAR